MRPLRTGFRIRGRLRRSRDRHRPGRGAAVETEQARRARGRLVARRLARRDGAPRAAHLPEQWPGAELDGRQQAGRRQYHRLGLSEPARGRRPLHRHLLTGADRQPHHGHHAAQLPGLHTAQHPGARIRRDLGQGGIADYVAQGPDGAAEERSAVGELRVRHRARQSQPRRDEHVPKVDRRGPEGGEGRGLLRRRRGDDRLPRRAHRRLRGLAAQHGPAAEGWQEQGYSGCRPPSGNREPWRSWLLSRNRASTPSSSPGAASWAPRS